MDIKVKRVMQEQDGLRREEILVNDSTTAYRVTNGHGKVPDQAPNVTYFFTRTTSGRYFELMGKHEQDRLSSEEEGELIGIHAKTFKEFKDQLER